MGSRILTGEIEMATPKVIVPPTVPITRPREVYAGISKRAKE